MADKDTKDTKDDAPTIDVNSVEFKAAVSSAVAEATTGLKTNRDELLTEKRELKEKHAALEGQIAELGDLETVKAMVDRFKNDKEAQLIADGKIDEVLSNRFESMRKDAETRIGKATERVAELEALVVTKDAKITSLVIDTQVNSAAAKLECAPTALVDIQRAARETFAINDAGELEARDAQGVLQLGPDGKLSLTPATWLEQQKDSAPHWWGPSAGGGAAGGVGVPGKPGLTAKALEKMSGREKIAAAMVGGR